MQKEIKNVYYKVMNLSEKAMDNDYPAYIFNSLTTIELSLEKMTKEIKEYEIKKGIK
tara:strand:- start:89 stop:259 length:171 start_codon:yes stop_codon:yes gene_type:complete